MLKTLFAATFALSALLLSAVALASGDDEAEPVFAPGADAQAAVAKATAFAGKKHKRALVIWGHDAGEGHVELYTALRRGRKPWPFYYEYKFVAVDMGPDGAANAALATQLGVELSSTEPWLTLLDAKGEVLAHREAAAFRDGQGWSREELAELLVEHAVEPQDAEVVLKAKLARATKQDKRLFVHLGAPW